MRIGRFNLGNEPSKEGGQAFVYFGVDPETGLPVAIKMARPTDWSHKRMRREIRIQGKLGHPNILPIIDHDGSRRWYAALRATSSLEELGPFDRSAWTRLRVGLLGVAEGVKYAHAAGYVHRDLAPGNILVFPDRWVVADWGFVYEQPHQGGRMTQPLERFGTPDFIAPEMVVDPMGVGPSADVYSLGRLAVWGTGLMLGEPADDPFDAWWRRFVEGTTAWDPAARWTMQDVVAHLRGRPRAANFAPRSAAGSDEVCPRCRGTSGRDASERCLDCHNVVAY